MTDTNEILFRVLATRSEINKLTSDRNRLDAQLHTAGLRLEALQDEAVKAMTPDEPFVLQSTEDSGKCYIITRVGDKLTTHHTHCYKKDKA